MKYLSKLVLSAALVLLPVLTTGTPIKDDIPDRVFLSQVLAPIVAAKLPASSSSVTLNGHQYLPYAPGGSCPDNTTPCVLTGFVVNTTGDTGVVMFGICTDGSCLTNWDNMTMTVSVTGAGGAWTEDTAARAISTAANPQTTQFVFVAPNLTAGTYNLTITYTGVTPFYTAATLFDAAGANHTTPGDSAVSNNGVGVSSTTPTVTSAGNVTNSGELGLALLSCYAHGNSNTGVYNTADLNLTDGRLALYKALTQGVPTTAAATCNSGEWVASLIALKP